MTTALITPPLLLLFLLLAQAYRIYAHNRAADSYRFQAIDAPKPPISILIVSPHPDDETLGASGLMQEAMKNGCPVHVVFLTCGDSFHVGVASYYHKLRVQAADYLHYGVMRQGEARAALAAIGLPPDHITFLGYPDQGLLPIWQQHWLPPDAYTSPYSRASAVPYQDAATPGAPYCGQSILNDLVAQIEKDRPTDIYVTHPNDDHPDHETAAAYVDLAATEVKARGESWAQGLAVHYFLVHRGDWPVPQGLHEQAPLAPPGPMVRLDTLWRSLPISPIIANTKEHSLAQYNSQQEVMGRFLSSFVRKNEMFGELGDPGSYLPLVPSDSVRINGDAGSWPQRDPTELDPVGDTILRDFQSGADIVDLYACSDKKNLYLRMDMHGQIEEQMHYQFNVRVFDNTGKSVDKSLTVSFSPRLTPAGEPVALKDGITAAWQDRAVEAAIPWTRFGAPQSGLLFVEGRTKLTGLTIDHTGIREIRVNFSNTLPQAPLS